MEVRMETIGRWLHEFHDRFRAVVDGLTPDALVHAPAHDTNSIAVLVRHSVLTEHGMLAGLAGQPLHRDLPSEFVAQPTTADGLRALLDEADERIDEMIDLISEDALAALYARPHDQLLTGGEWAVHTYGHVKEHLAHAELTRQILLAGD